MRLRKDCFSADVELPNIADSSNLLEATESLVVVVRAGETFKVLTKDDVRVRYGGHDVDGGSTEEVCVVVGVCVRKLRVNFFCSGTASLPLVGGVLIKSRLWRDPDLLLR